MTTKTKKKTPILFYAESGEPGWQERKNPMGGLTNYLKENRCFSSDPEIPTPGYRFQDYTTFPEFVNPEFPNASTHWRKSDWIVTRVEQYPAGEEGCGWNEVYFCYCKYEPIEPQWHTLPQLDELIESQKENAVQSS
ncbi:MAG: hypothetical protein SW833_15005 [Cyanobacteriota bacterium]|nr:hypothetical protein [Cyanobacteriota bacterium]